MQDILRSQFRIPIDLADQLRDAAEANNRSLNAEIVARLQMSFEEGQKHTFEINLLADEKTQMWEVSKVIKEIGALALPDPDLHFVVDFRNLPEGVQEKK